MIKPTILITGVGGGVGQSIIKCLPRDKYRLVGVDSELLGTGLYAVDTAYRIPYARDPEYIPRLLQICRDENCQLVFPGLDAELLPLATYAPEFTSIGVLPVVCSPKVVEICDDKLLTHTFLRETGFSTPKTVLASDDIHQILNFPFVLKPLKGGARSQGVYIIHDDQELNFRLSTIDPTNYVAQEYIPGEEFTCGSISFAGHCYGVIVMSRVLRDGDTYKAFVKKDLKLENHVRAVAEALQPFGPCNFQLREEDGNAYIFEINARCSGTSASRALVGFNEPLMTAEYLLKGHEPTYEIRPATILRYWKELLVENEMIGEMKKRGKLIGNESRL